MEDISILKFLLSLLVFVGPILVILGVFTINRAESKDLVRPILMKHYYAIGIFVTLMLAIGFVTWAVIFLVVQISLGDW